jgi:hypothetical protein
MNTIITTKSQIIAAFGSGAAAARAMGTTKQYVSSWPNILPKKIAYWATGALLAQKQGITQVQESPEHGKEATVEAGAVQREHVPTHSQAA